MAHGADARDGEIRDAMEAYGRCWDAHGTDPNCMDKLLTADFNAVMLNGRPADREAFIELVKKMPASNTWGKTGDRMPGAVIHFYGPTAVVTYGVNHLTPVDHVDQFTHVFVNTDGRGWRMARLHASHPNLAAQTKK